MSNREFYTLLVDTLVSIASYAATAFLAPEWSEHVLFLIGALQPVIVAVIAIWGAKDAAAIRAGIGGGYRVGKD
jgi:hypothetical protein